MKGWENSNQTGPNNPVGNHNANMFQNDFNLNSGLAENCTTLKSNASMPEAWRTLLNLNQLSVNSTQMFPEHWATQNSTSSLASFMRTLSVQHQSANQFRSLPADWAQHMQSLQQHPQAPPNPTTESSSFQNLASTAVQQIPLTGEKRSSEHANLPQLDQQKQPKICEVSQPETSIGPEMKNSSEHLRVLADVKLERAQKGSESSSKSSAASNTRWNSWSHEEEVFLVVAVLDRFFRRGSLASSGKSGPNQGHCWQEIQQLYERICRVWASCSENRVKPPLISRSSSALCRHFKIMKVRAVEGDKNGTKDGNFRRYLREWDTHYNLNGKLIPELD